MKKGVFVVNGNSIDPDQPAEIYSLIRTLLCFVTFYSTQ